MKNFILIKKLKSNLVNAEIFLYQHVATGAYILWLKNDEKEYSFHIGFHTPPYSNNGVAHVLEHMVLAGSKKYPDDKIFEKVSNKTLATSLNAYTSANHTVYHFATANKKDYENLLDFYLSSVFEPLLTYEVFLREGINLHSYRDGEIGGIVFNEMKGAYLDPDTYVYNHCKTFLLEGTPLCFHSGGYPLDILDLDYNEVIDFYNKYYHPSNSFTVICGDLEIGKVLKVLDQCYSRFQSIKYDDNLAFDNSSIHHHPKDKYLTFEMPSQSEDEHATLVYNFVDFNLSIEEKTLQSALFNYLLNYTASPLVTQILDTQLSANINSSFINYGKISTYSWIFSKVEESTFSALENKFFNIIRDIQNLQYDQVSPFLENQEFQLKVQSNASSYADIILRNYFLKNISLEECINLDLNLTLFEKTRIAIKTNNELFKLLKAKFSNLNNFNSKLLYLPNKNFAQKVDTEINQKLVNLSKSNTEPKGAEHKYSDNVDYPLIKRKYLRSNIQDIVDQREYIDGRKYITTNSAFIDVIEIRIFFDTEDFTIDELRALSFLYGTLVKSPTKKYSAEEVSALLYQYFGYFNIYEVLNNNHKTGQEIIGQVLYFSCLERNLDEVLDILTEVLLNSQLDFEKFSSVINSNLDYFEQDVVYSGTRYMILETTSSISSALSIRNDLQGIPMLVFLRKTYKSEQKLELFFETLKSAYKKLFDRNRIKLVGIGAKSDYEIIRKKIELFISNLRNSNNFDSIDKQDHQIENVVYATNTSVSYTSALYETKSQNRGELFFISNFLNTDYATQKIRLENNAYGGYCYVTFFPPDRVYIISASYRDPDPRRTLDIFNDLPGYLKNLRFKRKTINDYLLVAINYVDPYISLRDRPYIGFMNELKEFDYNDINRIKNEVLEATQSSINEQIEILSNIQMCKFSILTNKSVADVLKNRNNTKLVKI
ncbi:MAG: insulinase family protein [Candidatus Dojkabacteria bacterium]|nr:insulinase family protein [Candidatus Dojkabacteria bacterium]